MATPRTIPDNLFFEDQRMSEFLLARGLKPNSPVDHFRLIPWGTYGKSGKEPIRWIPICELSNSHLKAILATQKHITSLWRWIMLDLLTERAANGDTEDECTWNG